MRSSYLEKDLNYGDLLGNITNLLNPKKIIEIGILDGFSLDSFINNSNKNTEIIAFDLFDDFVGNHAHQKEMEDKYKNYKNVVISKGNFYDIYENISNIDIIHIDIANTGDVYEFAINNYLNKLSTNGILILEGGSLSRDNVEWMHKYNKIPIQSILNKYSNTLNIKTYGNFPSLTIIKSQ